MIVIFHYFEFIQVMKSDLKEYWTSTKNVLMHLYFVMYYFYYNRRMLQPEHYLLPLNHFHKDGAQDQGDLQNAFLESIFNFYMILYGMIILLDLFKVQDKMGQTAKVVEGVILRVIPFIIFMLAWVLAFSMLHRVIGNNVDPNK